MNIKLKKAKLRFKDVFHRMDTPQAMSNDVSNDWLNGVTYTWTSASGVYSEGDHTYYFQGQQGGKAIRDPQSGNYSFTVEKPDGGAVTLELSTYSANLEEEVTATATIAEKVSGVPIRFEQDPDKGEFQSLNGGASSNSMTVETDANGQAQVHYYPTETGNVDIYAFNDNNNEYDKKRLTINENNDEYSYLITHKRIGKENGKVKYEVEGKAYDKDGNLVQDYDYVYTTDFGTWSNGEQEIEGWNHLYNQEYLYAESDGTAHVTYRVKGSNSVGHHEFEVQYDIPPLTEYRSIDAPALTVSFSPGDDKLAYDNGEYVYIYDFSEDKVVSTFEFIAPRTGNPERPTRVRYSPDGTKIFVGSVEGSRIINANNGNSLTSNSDLRFNSYIDYAGDVVWINNDELLVGDDEYKGVYVIRASDLSFERTILNQSYWAEDLDVASDKALITIQEPGETRLYNINNWSLIKTFNGSGQGYHLSNELSSDGNYSCIFDDYDNQIYKYENTSPFNSSIISLGYGRSFFMSWNGNYTNYMSSLFPGDLTILNMDDNSEYQHTSNSYNNHEMDWSNDGGILAVATGSQIKFYLPFDMEEPIVTITEPEDNSQTKNAQIDLKGYVTDDTEVESAEYRVNSGEFIALTLDEDNRFNTKVDLEIGDNTIEVYGYDIYGKSSVSTVHVERLTDQDPPLLMEPNADPENPEIGNNSRITVKVIDSESGVDNSNVFCDLQLPDSNTIASLKMYDDGTNGDVTANDSIFSCLVTTETLLETKYILDFRASDKKSNSDTLNNGCYLEPYDLPTYSDFTYFPNPATEYDSLTIQITIKDQSGIINSWMHYGYDEQELWNAIEVDSSENVIMQALNDSVYEAQLPPQNVFQLFCVFEAEDGKENKGFSDAYVIEIKDVIKTWYVSSNSGSDFTGNGSQEKPWASIQHAINKAEEMDTILVEEGTYYEIVSPNGKNLVITSYYINNNDSSTIENTIIDAENKDIAVKYVNNEDSTSKLIGFTIQNGEGTGIYCDSVTIRLKNLIVKNNHTTTNGGGIRCDFSDVVIEDCEILNNEADYHGGGIEIFHCDSLRIINSKIASNTAQYYGGGIQEQWSNIYIVNSTITNNSTKYYEGGAIELYGYSASIINSTISNNSSPKSGGIAHRRGAYSKVINTILWGNSNYQIDFTDDDYPSDADTVVIEYSDIQDGQGGINSPYTSDVVIWQSGNITENPNFINLGQYPYQLGDNSPCIDVGTPDTSGLNLPESDRAGHVRIYNNRIDIGAFEYDGTKPVLRTLHVSIDGSDEYGDGKEYNPFRTIQKGYDEAYSGDTVLVHSGEYLENLVMDSKNVVLGSYYLTTNDTSYVSSTIINGDSSGSVITIKNSIDTTCLITGFTITNGASEYGGGILIENSDPKLFQLKIESNIADYSGGGISITRGSPILEYLTISKNKAKNYHGGGIRITTSSNPKITNIRLIGNYAYSRGGAIFCENNNLEFINIVFQYDSSYYGSGISLYNSDSKLINCTFYENNGNCIYLDHNCYLTVINSILWNQNWREIYFTSYNDPDTVEVKYSDIQDSDSDIGIYTNNHGEIIYGNGNINSDPLFVDSGPDLCQLSSSSPCRNAGDPDTSGLGLPMYDLLGTPRVSENRVDMGSYEYPEPSVFAENSQLPKKYNLRQNYPNPFNPITTIEYALPKASNVKIEVFNILGQKVFSFSKPNQLPGRYKIKFNASNLASGIYFFRLIAGDYVNIKKMLLLK